MKSSASTTVSNSKPCCVAIGRPRDADAGRESIERSTTFGRIRSDPSVPYLDGLDDLDDSGWVNSLIGVYMVVRVE